jgi:FixJ family two-component response regulator
VQCTGRDDGTRGPRDPTVYVVDDEQGVRDVLGWLAESVGLHAETFATATEFLAAYQPDRPGCLLLDVRLPGMSGLELQADLAARNIPIPIIVLTGYAEVNTAVRTLKMGAFDFIEKPFSEQLVLERVRQAIAADVAARRTELEHAEVAARLARLTPRQREVLQGVLEGKASKIIAAELGLSVKTVDVHRSQIMIRLEATSLAHLFQLLSLCPEAWPEGAAPPPRESAAGTSDRPKRESLGDRGAPARARHAPHGRT